MKANNDSSTIDFAYLPDVLSPENVDIYSQVRVPIIPTLNVNSTEANMKAFASVMPEETVIMKPEISTMSADTVLMPFAEAADGHAMNIDFHAMSDRMGANLRRMSEPVEEKAGMVKQVLGDMLDDIMGLKKKVA